MDMLESAGVFLRNNAEIIIALCALALSVHQGIVSRRHERLAARPFLAIDRKLVLDESRVEMVLSNHGPGLATIVKFEVWLDDKLREISADLWTALGKELAIPFVQGGGTAFYENDAVPPHSAVVLASYRAREGALVPIGQEVKTQLARVRLRIEYKSSFGERFVLETTGA